MTDDEIGSLIDPSGFLACWPTWLVSRRPRSADQDEFIAGIRQMLVTTGGKEGTVIPAFTDLDLAQRYVAQLDEPDGWEPVRFGRPEGFVEVLRRLVFMGETHVAFDPSAPPGAETAPARRLMPIPEVIRGVLAIPAGAGDEDQPAG